MAGAVQCDVVYGEKRYDVMELSMEFRGVKKTIIAWCPPRARAAPLELLHFLRSFYHYLSFFSRYSPAYHFCLDTGC